MTWVQLESSHSLIPWEMQGVNNSKELSHLKTSRPDLYTLCQSVMNNQPPCSMGGRAELSCISLQEQFSGLGNG